MYYKAGTYKKQWNENEVKDRFNWLCINIGEIFNFDVSLILK